jgi:MoxR-like ATPase
MNNASKKLKVYKTFTVVQLRKFICDTLGVAMASDGVRFASKNMCIHALEQRTWEFDFSESRFPRFYHKGEALYEPSQFEPVYNTETEAANVPGGNEVPSPKPSQPKQPSGHVSGTIAAGATPPEGLQGKALQLWLELQAQLEAEAEVASGVNPEEVEAIVRNVIASSDIATVKGVEDCVKANIVGRDEVKAIAEDIISKPLEIKFPEREPFKPSNVVHSAYERVLTCIRTGRPTYLVGPSGSGKSVLGEQMQEALSHEWDTKFGYAYLCCSAETGLADLVGLPRIHDGGFAAAPVLTAFESDNQLIFIDELDRMMGPVTTSANSMFAGSICPVPLRGSKPIATKGKNVFFLAAGNTDMSGTSDRFAADKQDGALRNRFRTQMVRVDYDTNLEVAIAAENGCKQIAEMVAATRKGINQERLDDEVGTRQVVDLCQFKLNGATDQFCAERLMAVYSPEEQAKVKPYLSAWL